MFDSSSFLNCMRTLLRLFLINLLTNLLLQRLFQSPNFKNLPLLTLLLLNRITPYLWHFYHISLYFLIPYFNHQFLFLHFFFNLLLQLDNDSLQLFYSFLCQCKFLLPLVSPIFKPVHICLQILFFVH